MKFVIGSSSKRKITIAQKVIRQFFAGDIEIVDYAATSAVPDTPYDKQTFDGSKNRALDAKAHVESADYYLGLETGLVERYGHIYEEAWSTVIAFNGKEFYGYSSGLKVPDYILRQMDELKIEHSDIMTVIEEEHGKLPNDSWSTYSGGMLVREISMEEAIRNTLVQIVAPENGFYKK